jgi:plastocyanin
VLALAAYAAASAQTCLTPNCAFAATPAPCANKAAPRTPTVLMTQSGVNFVFDPSNPKIEPGGCVVWRAANVQHSSSGNGCTDDPACGSPAPAACQWDSANVSSASPNPTATCAYDAGTFPPGTGNAYYCRIHASPAAGTMRGTLRVTSSIVLTVDKDLGTNSVKLSWTGGGVTGDVTYKVARDNALNPAMPAATTTTVNPDGGVTGTTFLDAGDLGNPQSHFYLVRNKQTNEP